MTTKTHTFEASIYRPCGGRSKVKDIEVYEFTISTPAEFRRFGNTVRCICKNLSYKWSQFKTSGTRLKLTGKFHQGPRSGQTFHVTALEVLQVAQPKLTEVSKKMSNQWEKSISKTI